MTMNSTEMRAIWADLLGRQEIEETDSFFELGGDSVLAMSLLLRLEERFGVSIEIYEIFDHPDLKGFSDRVTALSVQPA